MLYVEQMKASYILKEVKKYIDTELTEEERKRIYSIYDYDSYFDVVSNFRLSEELKGTPEYVKNLAKVAQNIVQRGFPTFAPDVLENFGYECNGLSEKGIRESLVIYDKDFHYSLDYNYMEKNNRGEVRKAQVNNTEVGLLSSCDVITSQYMEMQKPVEEVIDYPNTDMKRSEDYTRYILKYTKDRLKNLYADQRFDFTMTLPCEHCLNIEFDGPTHNDPNQQKLDMRRDQLLFSLMWEKPLRVKDNKDSRLIERTKDIVGSAFGRLDGELLSHSYITEPLFAARFAALFLNLVENGYIKAFSRNPFYLYVETKDNVNVFNFVIHHCLQLLYNLLLLTKKEQPQVAELRVRYKIGEKTVDYKITRNEVVAEPLKNFNNKAYIVIKDQMKRRLCFMDMEGYASQKNHRTVWMLSSYGQWSDYKIKTSDKCIRYDIEEKDEPVLTYFLQNIFGKPSFRPKQFPIIQNALNRKNVIGLLPTGSGKSITFQLSALLQPMASIVIAPLVSLMDDQVYNLWSTGISNVDSLNSTKNTEDRLDFAKKLSNNQIHIAYIAPERLQIAAFRESISELNIAYVVLDEAHCVSQWGHDFRTSYLRVGETAKKFAPDATFMALTGTASANVVTDIKRELHMEKNVAIVSTENFRRNELHFMVFNKDKNSTLEESIKSGIVSEALDKALAELAKIKKCKPQELLAKNNDIYTNAGIIFNPYAKKNKSSIKTVRQAIKANDNYKKIDIGIYSGQRTAIQKTEAQNDFVENRTAMLVSTNAFGMGIDKPNIRFTLHTCVPVSIEAFYQEAGRAGRDGKDAVNLIIAPPGNTEYEQSKDKAVYDYFISTSFPSKDRVKKAMRLLLEMKDCYIRKNASVMLDEITIEGSYDSDIRLIVDSENQKSIELVVGKELPNKQNTSINPDKSIKFKVNIDAENKQVSFLPIDVNDYNRKMQNNIVLFCYLKVLKEKIRQKIEGADFKTPEEIKNYIGTYTDEFRSGIIACIKKAAQGSPVTCYIRESVPVYSNPVETLFSELLSSKIMENKKLNISEANKSIMDSTQNLIDGEIKDKNKTTEDKRIRIDYWFEKFRDTYYKILEENNLPEKLRDIFDGVLNTISKDKALEEGEPVTGIDTDKLIYYLGLLGVYSNYERDYRNHTIKLTLEPVTKESLIKHIRRHLSGYETADYVERTIKNLKIFNRISDKNVEKLIIAAADYIIDYSYAKIREYRIKQTENMYKCIQANTVEGPNAFVENVYKYFEAKYYTELFKDVDKENSTTAIKWIEKVEDDTIKGNGTYLNNLSHLRSSAMKCMASRADAFTPYFLITYCTLRDPNLYIKDGLDKFLEGLAKLKKIRTSYTSLIKKVVEKSLATNDKRYLEEVYKFINDYKGKNRADLQEFANVITTKLNEGYGLFSSEDLEEA